MLGQLHAPGQKNDQHPFSRRVRGPQSRYRHSREKKNPLAPAPKKPPDRPAHSQSLYRRRYFDYHHVMSSLRTGNGTEESNGFFCCREVPRLDLGPTTTPMQCVGGALADHSPQSLNLVQRIRMSGDIPQLPYAFEVCMGQFHLYIYKMRARFYVIFFFKWKLMTKYY
jgi:hypothetical protein